MDTALLAAIFGFIGTAVGGVISWMLQSQRNKYELKILKESNKTEYAAEATAKHYLESEHYTDRSFETLKNKIGGFNDDELRKILVRVGAVRLFREDKSEWWRLLSRNQEAIDKKRQKDDKKG
jgi:hypothetical protein